jgi:hypothetical protein
MGIERKVEVQDRRIVKWVDLEAVTGGAKEIISRRGEKIWGMI